MCEDRMVVPSVIINSYSAAHMRSSKNQVGLIFKYKAETANSNLNKEVWFT